MVTKNDRFTALFTVGYLYLCLIPHFCDAQADTEYCGNGVLRLVGGSDSNEGRVEICHENRWGTVCDDFWNDNDAKVVCEQLGLPTSGATAISYSYFGEGRGDIWLDDVHCYGSESRLSDCYANPFGFNDCDHSEDAGVECGYESDSLASASLIGGSVGGGIVLVCFLTISISLLYYLQHRKQRRAAQARRVRMTQTHISHSSASVTIVPPSSSQAESGSSSETYNSSSMPEFQFGMSSGGPHHHGDFSKFDGSQFGVPRMDNPPPYSEMDPLIDDKAEQDEELTELPPCPQVEAEEVVD